MGKAMDEGYGIGEWMRQHDDSLTGVAERLGAAPEVRSKA
jgi:hypothetical protein